MTGLETVPINNLHLALLLDLYDAPLNIVLGKPNKDAKSIKVKNFSKRVQKSRTNKD